MSDYCELEILTPDNKPPITLYCDDICFIKQEMNDNLMFDVTIHELSLSDCIGNLRATERNNPCKIFIKYGIYGGTLIENKWLEDLTHLPYLRPWQSYAIHLNKGTFIEYQLNWMKKRGIP